MNKYEATNLQIKQGLIQTKGMHLFYQLQVVFNDVIIRVSLVKPQKWSIESVLTMIHIFQKQSIYFVYSHLKFLKEFLSMVLIFIMSMVSKTINLFCLVCDLCLLGFDMNVHRVLYIIGS